MALNSNRNHYQNELNNHANQLNPNNWRYYKSRKSNNVPIKSNYYEDNNISGVNNNSESNSGTILLGAAIGGLAALVIDSLFCNNR